jgi:hypothetical protein
MKILFSLLTILILNKDCNQTKSVDSTYTAINSEDMSDVTQEDTTIWYEATTRGFYEKIWVTKDSITITNDRNHITSNNYPTSEEDWDDLVNLIKNVDVTALPDLEAPTSLRHHDGAAFATLAVTQNKIETKSNSFDHEYPPKAIEAVVNKVLSMKEKHEKN